MDKKENELPIIKPTIKVRKEFQVKQNNLISKNAISSIFSQKKNQKENDLPTIKVKKEDREKLMNMKNFLETISKIAIFMVNLPISLLCCVFGTILIVFFVIPFYIFYSVMLSISYHKK
ncbi:MAG: hypothetical protein F6K23_02525 [Okeania sp. SIO2C9]|uniref:hypothetical protein n=1 Tax=Okeania sp. SIO2C9 TaxID=2607791 RepID=UPI0013BF7472|nr:hypothetical protein [Okeania sp. SIO2C9]NEQ72047.1 hypothetical protein [Okeania sp. SIO2C9]